MKFTFIHTLRCSVTTQGRISGSDVNRLMKKKTDVSAKINNLSVRVQETAVYTTFLLSILMISRGVREQKQKNNAFPIDFLLLVTFNTEFSENSVYVYIFNTFSARNISVSFVDLLIRGTQKTVSAFVTDLKVRR
jgi:hypothetical protein